MSLSFFLAVEERLEKVCFRGRQRLRPHGHRLYVLLQRFGFLKGVLDGAVKDCLGLCARPGTFDRTRRLASSCRSRAWVSLHGIVDSVILSF